MTDLFVPLDDHPAYRQIANVIEQRIVGRSLRAGDPLPSEMDLARQFGVNRSTIREAIRELETHGLLGRVHNWFETRAPSGLTYSLFWSRPTVQLPPLVVTADAFVPIWSSPA